MRSKFSLPLLLLMFTACARDPEIDGNDPAQPRVEVEVASRISAEVTIASSASEPAITFGAEIVRIVDGEELSYDSTATIHYD